MTHPVGQDDGDATVWVRVPTARRPGPRGDRAAAHDVVGVRLDLERPGMRELVERFAPVVVRTQVTSPRQYLRRPDLGRRLSPIAREWLRDEGTHGADTQIVIGDGLSASAVHAQVPTLVPLLATECATRNLTVGRPVIVHHARVDVINEIGDILLPVVVILLIGERPGLAAAESLSAHIARGPRAGHTDADRTLLANIHAGGIPVPEAAARIASLAQALIARP